MRIAVATTTRADWGLLSPLATELRERGVDVRILAAGMHYMESMGLTYREIEADGFRIDSALHTPHLPAPEAAACLEGAATFFDTLRPDAIICLGDRFEMLAIAMSATMSRVPIIHIAGGAISEGAIDDSIRHAITKLASIHLCETPRYRERVISMSEDPNTVFHTGAIGVHNILNTVAVPRGELEEFLGFSFTAPCVLCTMHTATLDKRTPESQLGALLSALRQMPELSVLFTHPNNDTDPAPLIRMLNEFAATNPDKYKVVPSLGRVRYISALHNVQAVIGNSSGGIVEVPSMQIPTLDIGIRQRGRDRSQSVIHADCDSEAILTGLQAILGDKARSVALTASNPYYLPDTPKLMADIILSTDFSNILPKKFHDS